MGQRRVPDLHEAGSAEAAHGLAPTIGSADFEDSERTLAFVDEELTFTTSEMRPSDISFMDNEELAEMELVLKERGMVVGHWGRLLRHIKKLQSQR